jgi:hypothetical protein
MTEMLHQLNSRTFLATPSFVTGCLCCNKKALVDELGVIRSQMAMHNRSENGHST